MARPFASSSPGGQLPLLVAHRAGNSLTALWAAERLRATPVEADVHLYRGRLEVRHLKTVGPIPILWDRWELRAPWRPRLHLAELLAASSPETELVLDLKGPRIELARRVLETIGPCLSKRRFTVCARWWRLLEPFAGTPVRRVHSVANARQLRQVLRRFSDQRLEGVSIHERLVDSETIASLREIAEFIMAWPVNQPERARALLGLGIDALITDDASALSHSGILGATT